MSATAMLFKAGVILFAAGVIGSLFVIFVLPNLPRHQPRPISKIRNQESIISNHRQPITTTRPTRTIDYAAERTLIRLALAGGMAPGAVAGLLRGSPSARRRRVLKVAREVQRVAVVPQKLEAATA